MSLKNISIILSFFLFLIPFIYAEDFTATAYRSIQLYPCNATTTQILVENAGNDVVQLVASLSGTASSFATLTPDTFILLPNEYEVITEQISIPCAQKSGNYNLNIVFKSQSQQKTLSQDFKIISSQKQQPADLSNITKIMIFVSIFLFILLLLALIFIIVRIYSQKKPDENKVVEEPMKKQPKRPYPWEEYFMGRKRAARKKEAVAVEAVEKERKFPWKFLVLIAVIALLVFLALLAVATIKPGGNLLTIFLPNTTINVTQANASQNASSMPQKNPVTQYTPYLIAGVIILAAIILILEYVRRTSE